MNDISHIAAWTGSTWQALAIVDTDETLYLGGDFTNIGNTNKESYRPQPEFVICHFCYCELREDEINSGKCPNCGGPIRRRG